MVLDRRQPTAVRVCWPLRPTSTLAYLLDIAALEAVNVQMAAYELEQDDPPERVQATALASANTRP